MKKMILVSKRKKIIIIVLVVFGLLLVGGLVTYVLGSKSTSLLTESSALYLNTQGISVIKNG